MFHYKDVSSLTEAEKSVYSYILIHKEKVAYMRVRELADASHTSPATVLRFTQKLGYESFVEFKLDLKKELQKQKTTRLIDSKEVVESFFSRTLTDQYEEELDEVAEQISDAELVMFFGIGTSGILAEYASRWFSNFGKQTMYIKDPFYPFEQFGKTYEQTVVFVLSVSGETTQTIEQVQRLKELGGYIVSITNSSYNTLARISDRNIAYHVAPETLGDGQINITSQLPVLYLFETLAKKHYAQSETPRSETETISNHP